MSLNPKFPQCVKSESKPHKFCPGCGHAITLKALGWAIDEMGIQKKSVVGLDIGCSLLAWDFFDIDSFQTHHGRTVPVVVGYKLSKPESIAIAYVGDGGAYAIGAQHLMNARMRNNNITMIVVNNTNYGMTGGQEAPTTMPGQISSTTPEGADNHFMRGPEAVAAMINKPCYVARGSCDNLIHLKAILKKALTWQQEGKGFSFVEVLSFCPLNWKTDAKQTVNRLNEMKKLFPVGEIENENKEMKCEIIIKETKI